MCRQWRSAVVVMMLVWAGIRAAYGVELDTMCFIRDTAELFRVAQSVAPEGIVVTGYTASGGCDTMTMTLTIQGSPWPIPVVMRKVNNCSLYVRASLGPVPVVDTIVNVCELPAAVARVAGVSRTGRGLRVVAVDKTGATVSWSGDHTVRELLLYRMDGVRVDAIRPAVGQTQHTWKRGRKSPGRYVCVAVGQGWVSAVEYTW